METTPTGVSQQSPVQSLPQNALEDRFQGLFDAEVAREKEQPKTTQPNPAELAAAQQPEPTDVEALGGEQAQEPQGPEYDSLEQYLEQAKLDPAAFQALPVTVKVDGKTQKVPLADVIKSFQLEQHVNNKSIALSEQQRQFEQEQTVAQNLWKQSLTQARQLGELARHQLMAEFQNVNWNELMQKDPVQWTVQQQLFQNRSAAINQHLNDVAAAEQAQSEQLRQQQAALLPKEREKMLERVPEWRDQAKFDSDRKVMSAYAKNLGFSDAELASVFDHRYMTVLHDAAQFRALQASNPEVLKRVRAAPQMARPGTRTQKDPKAVAKQQALERAAKNPRDQDAAAAAFEFLIN